MGVRLKHPTKIVDEVDADADWTDLVWMTATPRLARLAANTFYRLTIEGALPSSGPVLIIANHPNSLVDPVLVFAAAERPVRFLAKAPLFEDFRIAWLLRAVGAVPVHRPQDDPSQLSKNADVLGAAGAALAGGAAIAVFPEGKSHNEPSLAPLKTGAARIALLAAGSTGDAVPIVPIGLNMRDKETFRSDALVVVGEPVAWSDLASRGADDVEAVRTLTARMDDALRGVTLNVERWEDAPVVECAEAVWRVERGGSDDPRERLERQRIASELLAGIRRDPSSRWRPLARAVRRHARSLAQLDLTPADLNSDLNASTAVRWSLQRLPLLLLPAFALAIAGLVLWWIPYRLTGIVAEGIRGERDIRSTYKLYGGIVLYAAWLAILVIVAAALGGPLWAVAVLLLAPALGITGLWIRERWRLAWRDARRYFILRRHPWRVRDLRRRQHELAEGFEELVKTAGA
jgi:1-acyl-sn-glycerol-3-phosphate acyltransferase